MGGKKYIEMFSSFTDPFNCFCSVLELWLGSTIPIRVVLFLFPLFSSTWSSVFRLYFLLERELWHSDCCDPFLACVRSTSISSVAPLHSISVSVLFLATEWLHERTKHLDIFLISAHHSILFYFRCYVYWWKGSVTAKRYA